MSKATTAAAKKRDVVLLPVADLKMTFDVRKVLNEDRVLYFMELYEACTKLPPIEVIRGTMHVHDGRHRKAALDHLNRKAAECVLVEPMEYVDQMMDAFTKNVSNCPFPPTRADIIFVMRQLLEAGTPNSQVQQRFQALYRVTHVRELLKEAHSAISAAKMARAKNAVAHGELTVKAAAEEHGVALETLQTEISGVKKRRRANNVGDIKREISNRNRANTQKTVLVIKGLLERFEDGEMTEECVLEVLLHIRHLYDGASKRLDEWFQRLETTKGVAKAKA
jgi:hypothetical protein